MDDWKILDRKCMMFYCLIIICIYLQASMAVTWSILDMPATSLIQPLPNRLELVCVFPFEAFVASLSFNILLLVISVFFAFKARKLPDNYNETRFISFCVYSTVIIWLAFIPSYFTVESAQLECVFLSLAVIINAYLILICIIIPKVYALYFVEKCDLHVTHQKWKSRGGTMRFMEESSYHGEIQLHDLQNALHRTQSLPSTSSTPMPRRRQTADTKQAVDLLEGETDSDPAQAPKTDGNKEIRRSILRNANKKLKKVTPSDGDNVNNFRDVGTQTDDNEDDESRRQSAVTVASIEPSYNDNTIDPQMEKDYERIDSHEDQPDAGNQHTIHVTPAPNEFRYEYIQTDTGYI